MDRCLTKALVPRNREAWFDTRLSYNPAIHRTKQALFHGAIVRDLNTNPVPPPHPELFKYFEPPRRVLKRAREAIEECKKAFNVREGRSSHPVPSAIRSTERLSVPKKPVRIRKEEHVRANDEDEDMLLLDQKGPSQSQRPTQSQSQQRSPGRSQAQKKKAENDDDSSATEPEDEEEDLLLDAAPRKDRAPPLPTPARSLSPDGGAIEIDRRRAPGRIVGASFPLEDFRANIARGDVVTKAVEDLAFVIKDVVAKPFASRRFDEMLECMHELRKVALQVGGSCSFLVHLVCCA